MLAADCDSCLQTRPVTAAMTAFSITTGNITASPGRLSAEEWPSSHRHSCSGPPARSTSLDFYCAIFFIAPMIILNFYVHIFFFKDPGRKQRSFTQFFIRNRVFFQGKTMIKCCPAELFCFAPLLNVNRGNIRSSFPVFGIRVYPNNAYTHHLSVLHMLIHLHFQCIPTFPHSVNCLK